MTTLTSGIFSRPTQADFFSPKSCTLNIILRCDGADAASDSAAPGDATRLDAPGAGQTDTTPPTVALSVTPTDVAGGPARPTINITGSVQDSNLASYELTINGVVSQQGSDFADPSAPIGITIGWDLRSPNIVPSGTYTVTLTAIDQAGNSGPNATATQTIQVDNDAPVTTVTGGEVLLQSGSITPNVTATDPQGVTYFWTADANNPSELAFNSTAVAPTFTPDTEGTYTFTLSTTDGLGNIGTKNFIFDYAPTLATIPLPTHTSPASSIAGQTAATTSTPTPAIRDISDAVQLDEAATPLSNSINASSPIGTPPVLVGSGIAATKSGWSVFGVLWYWWLIVIAAVFISWMVGKRIFFNHRFRAIVSVAEVEGS